MNLHYSAIAIVSLLFVAGLCFCFYRLIVYHRAFRHTACQLLDDARQVQGAGLPQWVGLPGWLSVVVGAGRNAELLTNAREISVLQLESLLCTTHEYLALQKLQTTAPLVGVVLTAVGVGTIDGDLTNVQSLAGPLVGGVTAGAVLAIICQALLFFAEIDIEKSQRAGKQLLDEVWLKVSSELKDPQQSMVSATESLEATVDILAEALGSFPNDVSGLTKKFTEIEELARVTFTTLEDVAPQLRSTVLDWQGATTSLKESVSRELIPSHKSMKTTAQQFLEHVERFSQISHHMDSACQNLHSGCVELQQFHSTLMDNFKKESDSHAASVAEFEQRFEESHHRLVGQSLKGLEYLLGNLSEAVDTHLSAIHTSADAVKGPLQETAKHLSAAAPGLKESISVVSALSCAATDFSDTVSEIILPSFQQLNGFESLLTSLNDSVGRLGELLDNVSRASSAGQQFSEMMQRRAMPTVEVLQRATGAFEDSVHCLSECSRELSGVLDKLVKFHAVDVPLRADSGS